MTDSGGGRLSWPMIVTNAALAGVLGLVLVIAATSSAQVPPADSPGVGYVSLFTPPESPFEVLLDHGDGQAYGAVAQDPTLSRPDVFGEGAGQAAYFVQRPVLGYLVWALSLGQPANLQVAFTIAMTIGAALAGGSATAFVQALGRNQDPRLAIAVLMLPGSFVSLSGFGQETLALAFALIGATLWLKHEPSPVLASVAFAVAGLTRETMLLVPLVLGAHELFRSRATTSLVDRVSRVLPLAAAFVPYGVWLVVVRVRLGASAAPRGTLGPPFVGLVNSAAQWSATDALVAALTIGLAVVALVRRREGVVAWFVGAYLLLSVLLGSYVWNSWKDFGRVLLPGSVFATLSLLRAPPPTASAGSRAGAEAR